MQQQREDEAMLCVLQKELAKYEFYSRDFKGALIPLCKQEIIDGINIWKLKDAYRNAQPKKPIPTLKDEWKSLFIRTWKRFIYRILAPIDPKD